jgi:Uma2 family endonuclease
LRHTCAVIALAITRTDMETEIVLDRDALQRRWDELAADPESPDRYELTEFGELVLSPKPTNDHQRVSLAVARSLEAQLGPEAGIEISVFTDRGIRVPDVVWMPGVRWREVKGKSPFPFVPDVCVEVLSPGNSCAEIRMKTGAYLRGGAREVIIVSHSGEVDHFGPEGRREVSVLGIRLALPTDLF